MRCEEYDLSADADVTRLRDEVGGGAVRGPWTA